jgi:hypothetical protein
MLGCATAYKGEGPNLTVTGESAIKEYEKFQFADSHAQFAVLMGEDTTPYNILSVMPFVKNISPEAYSEFESAQRRRRIQESALLISVVSALTYIADTDNQFFGSAATMTALTSIGFSIVWRKYADDGVELYNRDLATKLRVQK